MQCALSLFDTAFLMETMSVRNVLLSSGYYVSNRKKYARKNNAPVFTLLRCACARCGHYTECFLTYRPNNRGCLARKAVTVIFEKIKNPRNHFYWVIVIVFLTSLK